MLTQSALAEPKGLGAKDATLTGERPGVGGKPTIINIGVHLFDVDDIDDARQRFSADVLIDISWNDPRLALPKRKHEGLYRTVAIDDIWSPRGLVVNDRGLKRNLPRIVEIDDLGNVRLQQRLFGELALDLNFQEFPFDVQYLPIDIVSYRESIDEMQFVFNEKMSGYEELFSVEGWQLQVLEPKIGEYKTPSSRVAYPRFTYVIGATRDTQFYVLTVFLPMTFIMLMAWSVFWLQPDIIPARISISTAAIFSFIAFGFSIRSNLPEVSYMTRADTFVMGCTFLVFIALAVAVSGSRLANSDRMDMALRVNSIARWAYIFLFLITALTALYI
ncbi:MAG: hypothetical protein GY727_09120 [Gammaproteobacteria bacterium]|nr:hypothetical protein [Gammaproteobacteria bacterium]MCP4276252.1 hypothetical protein [Gammaproteobacteria bacterium]MCP4832949.1 hypothetical protein [Gammaproteobacteria bacterium]